MSFPTVWAFRSRKVKSSLSPPPSLLTALLDLSPSTFKVIECGALTWRPLRVDRAAEGFAIPFEIREDMLPLPDVMTLFMICCAFAVGLGARPVVVGGRLDRAGPLGGLLLLGRLLPPVAESISRSPSLSTLPAPPARRLAIPPR